MFFTKNANGERKPNLLIFGLILTSIVAYIYLAKDSKNQKEEITKNPGGILRENSNIVYNEGASPELIAKKEAALQKAKENESEFNTTSNQEHLDKIESEFEKNREIEAKGDVITEQNLRIEAFLRKGVSKKEEYRLVTLEDVKNKKGDWMSFAERLKAEGKTLNTTNSNISLIQTDVEKDLISQKIAYERLKTKDPLKSKIEENIYFDQDKSKPLNFLPRGTYIPVVLMEDAKTSDLRQMVTALVANNVVFRKQIQLPKGVVKLQGYVDTEVISGKADITFTNMLFADGTELPINAFACQGMDYRYPEAFKTRGLIGKKITPPFYIKAKAAYYTALLTAGNTYLTDSARLQGQDNTISGDNNSVANNERLSSTDLTRRAAISASSELLNLAKETAIADMKKHKPYMTLEKGTAFFVQLQETTNINARSINGVAKASLARNQAQRAGNILPTAPLTSNNTNSNNTPSATTAGSAIDAKLLEELKQLEDAAAQIKNQ